MSRWLQIGQNKFRVDDTYDQVLAYVKTHLHSPHHCPPKSSAGNPPTCISDHSRVTSMNGLKIYNGNRRHGQRTGITNIVYKEIFNNIRSQREVYCLEEEHKVQKQEVK
ncbi:unnamed protein product [Microthlaspi erraticum]|uniref:Uncharacterized protein n=1 Tax=Microthlaspi erraticum TaxID=1685480 RepID=A0A6D2K3I9_9BRAS|nr:unnamed protein product [Microthlaspi erraticum]